MLQCLRRNVCLLFVLFAALPVVANTSELIRAELQLADGSWQRVELPDRWRARGAPAKGEARYRLRFELGERPTSTLALRGERVALSRRVLLNGQLIEDRRLETEVWRHQRPQPALIELDPQALRDGENQLELQLALGGAGGLSALQLGPLATLRERHEREWLWDVSLPQALNFATAGLALFMLLIWWQRRRERVIGLLGGIWLLASLRNTAYYAEASWVYSDAFSVLFSSVHACNTSLLGWMALSLTGRSWPAYSRSLLGLTIAWPLAAALAVGAGHPLALRQWGYPLLVALSLPALWLMLQAGWRAPRRWQLALLAGIGAVFAAAVHDLLFLAGQTSLLSRLWQPLVVPLVMAGFAWALMLRLVRSIGAVERSRDELEQAVAQRTLELQRAYETRSQFLAHASHDLGQPIMAVGVMVGLAAQRAQDAQQSELLARARQGLDALQGLMRNLLDLSRLGPGRLQVNWQATPLQPLFDELQLHLAEEARQQGLRLRVRPANFSVRSDPVLLAQVLRNLAVNAVRHTQRGGVLLAARRRGAELWIEVWDSGPGIPEAQRERIFEEFVRLGTPARQPGWGLGLAIVKQSLALLRHPLELQSRAGSGTRFRLRLALES